ncbi:MAG TPA: hypothetical protein VND93_02580, partial [Myxococcales bacterium]|nr:hypothetical protein [Myxococcales bacterium]
MTLPRSWVLSLAALISTAAWGFEGSRDHRLQRRGRGRGHQIQRYVTLYEPSILLGQNVPGQGPIKTGEQGAAACGTQYAWQLANAGAATGACLPDVTVPAG